MKLVSFTYLGTVPDEPHDCVVAEMTDWMPRASKVAAKNDQIKQCLV